MSQLYFEKTDGYYLRDKKGRVYRTDGKVTKTKSYLVQMFDPAELANQTRGKRKSLNIIKVIEKGYGDKNRYWVEFLEEQI